MKLLFNIAWTHVSTRIRQTLVGTLSVAMGVGFTIMMAGIMQGSQVDFLRQLVDAMPHITVTDERHSRLEQPAEEEYGAVNVINAAKVNHHSGIENAESVVSSLVWVPGAVAASVKTNAIIAQGESRIGVTVTGIDPRTEARVSKLATQMRSGELNDLTRAPNGIVIGDGIAQTLGLGTGSAVLLETGDIQISATVVGVFRTGLKQVDDTNVFALTRVAQVLIGQSGLINQLKVRLRDPLKAQQVATQIEAQVGYKAVSWEEANADLLGTFAVRDFIMMTVMSAMLLTSSFATYNIVSTITNEKRPDIAIMKSIGMREYHVRRIFVLEAAMIGAVGILFGWVLGYLLCFGLGKITVYNPISGATLPLQMYYSPMQYIVAGAVSIVCCAGAAYFPARKATSVHPVEIIRGAS